MPRVKAMMRYIETMINSSLHASRIPTLLLYLASAFCFVTLANPALSEELACAKQGETAGGSCVGCKSCCAGLIVADTWLHKTYRTVGCDAPSPPGGSGVCVKCGDGKCDAANSENRCNCPKDCS